MNLLFCLLVIGCSLHGAQKKHEGPPLLVSDIFTNGKPDKYYSQLLDNIRKTYPALTTDEISECLTSCKGEQADLDVITECQEFMLWKLGHLDELPKDKSSFKIYKKQRD